MYGTTEWLQHVTAFVALFSFIIFIFLIIAKYTPVLDSDRNSDSNHVI